MTAASLSKSPRDHGSISSCEPAFLRCSTSSASESPVHALNGILCEDSLLLYPLVLALIGLPAYWVYTSFVEPKLFPKKKAIKKRSASTSVVAKSPTPRPGTPSNPDEWIPEHHLRTRRTVSGRNLVAKGAGAITSGDETSGNESQTPRRSARANKGRKAA